jgi:hypothetical protein
VTPPPRSSSELSRSWLGHTLVTKVETAQGVITLDRRTVGRGEGGKLVLLEGGAGATSGAEAGTPGGKGRDLGPVAEGGGSEA